MSKQFNSRPLVGEITQPEATAMISAYAAEKNNVTKCVWFGLDQMDQMVTLLKAERLLGRGTDGVRLYFGKYTPESLGDLPKIYLGLNTIVFVSTYENTDDQDNSYHQDYFDGLELPHPMIPENRGELCQPNCQGTTTT